MINGQYDVATLRDVLRRTLRSMKPLEVVQTLQIILEDTDDFLVCTDAGDLTHRLVGEVTRWLEENA